MRTPTAEIPPASPLPGFLRALRRSMAAQIGLAIAAVSVTMILAFGTLADRFLEMERREETEQALLANLAFIRDDIAIAAPRTPASLQALLDGIVRRTRGLHAAVAEEQDGILLAASSRSPVAPQARSAGVLPAESLPPAASMADFGALRDRFSSLTSVWEAPDGTHFRLLTGRIASSAAAPHALLVTVAVETTATRELRARNRRYLENSLWVTALLATVFGVWIARRIVVRVRRFGATASRVGVHDLHERLPLDDTPTELVESTQAFNHMLDRLQDAFERLSAFSSDLAHDLRTPLGNLLGEAQVALSRPRSAEEYRAVIESAVEEYERLSRMITNMLFLARADNQPAIYAQWIALPQAMERVVGYFELLAEERGVALRTDIGTAAGAQPRVWADESMFVRAVGNLVSNALQFAPRGSAITLSAFTAGTGDCRMQVANEGPPIPAELQARIFQRFFRVDASRQGSASGSGLGLAIVRSIMEMHGGSALVASAAGHPTVFSLDFPGEGRARAART